MTALTRRLFAEFVGTFADHIVITDGNYYYEDPQVIRDELYAGLTTHPSTTIVPDRKLALKQAVSSLKKGDALLILGDTVRGYWHRHYGIEETMEHDAIYNEAYYTFDDKEFILGLL